MWKLVRSPRSIGVPVYVRELVELSVRVQWTGDVISQMLASVKYADQQIHRDLKEKLYYDVIQYFDQGKACDLRFARKWAEVCTVSVLTLKLFL